MGQAWTNDSPEIDCCLCSSQWTVPAAVVPCGLSAEVPREQQPVCVPHETMSGSVTYLVVPLLLPRFTSLSPNPCLPGLQGNLRALF